MSSVSLCNHLTVRLSTEFELDMQLDFASKQLLTRAQTSTFKTQI